MYFPALENVSQAASLIMSTSRHSGYLLTNVSDFLRTTGAAAPRLLLTYNANPINLDLICLHVAWKKNRVAAWPSTCSPLVVEATSPKVLQTPLWPKKNIANHSTAAGVTAAADCPLLFSDCDNHGAQPVHENLRHEAQWLFHLQAPTVGTQGSEENTI